MKHVVQRDVEEFHREVVGIEDGAYPAIRRPELRAELIREEAGETINAILSNDLIGAIDGFCDLLCVTYGAAAEFGIDLAPFWDEVHRTNMAKVGGPVRADGKRLKPPGWTPPNLAAVLRAQTDGVRTTHAPMNERAEAQPCRACGQQFEPGQAYVVEGPWHVRCAPHTR